MTKLVLLHNHLTFIDKMHSITPYTIRCFDRNLPGDLKERYYPMDKIGSLDFYEFVKGYIKDRSNKFNISAEDKVTFGFTDVVYDDENRLIYGWMRLGRFGYGADIIHIETGATDFRRGQKNAELIKHYFVFFIPRGVNEAICLLHSFQGNGVKSTLYSDILQSFRSKVGLSMQMNPLAYEKALEPWLEGCAKEIIVTKFSGVSAIEDVMRKMGHEEQTLILKPKRKSTFGKLRDFRSKGTDQNEMIEVLSNYGAEVKTQVELNGKKRIFKVSAKENTILCQIDLDDDLVTDEGMPTLNDIHTFSIEIIKDCCSELYNAGMVVLK